MVGLKFNSQLFDARLTFFSRKPLSIYLHWLQSLKPVLLSFHAGQLHSDWKTPFLEDIVKKKIARYQDINWQDFREKFPTQTTASMSRCLTIHSMRGPDTPLFELFEKLLPELKHKKELPVLARRREEIVASYDRIRFSK